MVVRSCLGESTPTGAGQRLRYLEGSRSQEDRSTTVSSSISSTREWFRNNALFQLSYEGILCIGTPFRNISLRTLRNSDSKPTTLAVCELVLPHQHRQCGANT
ncbi:hypothetical protein EVAR_24775_1 [Eumeta japonica]|uniref:Uncharacterized protein n=1 Tax=Eumeta variegata TaxID=151549 RepID=A0A4C1W2T4_EUMVA|nr:hypothetical protein EVAR_24775_1 [Eumeta japonica]